MKKLVAKKKKETSNKSDNKLNKIFAFFRNLTKKQIIGLVIFVVFFVTLVDLLIGHYHIVLIPKMNTSKAEYYFSHDNIDYYLGDSYKDFMFYGFFPTSLKKEIKSGRLTYEDMTKRAISIDPKCWCSMKYYVTTLAKFIDCGETRYGRRVVIIPITSKLDSKYCSVSYKR